MSQQQLQQVNRPKHSIRSAVSSAISIGKSSSRVLGYAIDSVQNTMSPAYEKWDPLLQCLDDQFDSVVSAVKNVSLNDRNQYNSDDGEVSGDSSGDEGNSNVLEEKGNSEVHWEQLRSNFMNSTWFLRVEKIFEENDIEVLESELSPAEAFYNSAIEVYLQTAGYAEFLEGLKGRLGTGWDDRLCEPSSVLFSTAKTVSSIVGIKRFVSGALQLGKVTINSAFRMIFVKKDQLLDYTDGAIEYLLPNHEAEGKESSGIDSLDSEDLSQKKRPRTVRDIASKFSRRVKQRMPSLETLTALIKSKLIDSAWFTKVDEILMQNILMKSFGAFARPAEHFYDTAANTFIEKKRSLDEFIAALKAKLGNAWDDRLKQSATEFYESAAEASDMEC